MNHFLARAAWAWPALLFLSAAVAVRGAATPVGGPKKPLLDAYGDPLPPGATARFGTLRWRMPGWITTVALSPDGKRVAAATQYDHVAVLDVETGRESQRFAGHRVGCLAFSPDGQYLAAGGGFPGDYTGSNFIRVWDLGTGKEKACWEQDGWINYLAFLSDGQTLISGGHKQNVIVREFPSGKKLREFPTGGEATHPCSLSPNGRWLAVAVDDWTLHLYTFASGYKRNKMDVPESLLYFEFSPDNRTLLTVGKNALRLWEVDTGKLRLHVALKENVERRGNFKRNVERWAHFAPDAKKLAVLGDDQDIAWLDSGTAKALPSWKGHRGVVQALVFSSDGRTAVSGGGDGTLRVWDVSLGKAVGEPPGLGSHCNLLAYTPDGKTLLAGSAYLHFLDAKTLQQQQRLDVDPNLGPWTALSLDRKLVAFAGAKGQVLLVDLQSRKVLRTLQRPKWQAYRMAFAPDGKTLFAVGHDTALRVWDVDTGEERPPLCTDLKSASDVAVTPEGKVVVIGFEGAEARFRFWDAATSQEEKSLFTFADELLLSRDGKLMVTRYRVWSLTLWDVKRRCQLSRFPELEKDVESWAFSDDGKVLAFGHFNGSFSTWNTTDGKKLADVKGHRGCITALAFSPDGDTLISGSIDGTVLKWGAVAWRGK